MNSDARSDTGSVGSTTASSVAAALGTSSATGTASSSEPQGGRRRKPSPLGARGGSNSLLSAAALRSQQQQQQHPGAESGSHLTKAPQRRVSPESREGAGKDGRADRTDGKQRVAAGSRERRVQFKAALVNVRAELENELAATRARSRSGSPPQSTSSLSVNVPAASEASLTPCSSLGDLAQTGNIVKARSGGSGSAAIGFGARDLAAEAHLGSTLGGELETQLSGFRDDLEAERAATQRTTRELEMASLQAEEAAAKGQQAALLRQQQHHYLHEKVGLLQREDEVGERELAPAPPGAARAPPMAMPAPSPKTPAMPAEPLYVMMQQMLSDPAAVEAMQTMIAMAQELSRNPDALRSFSAQQSSSLGQYGQVGGPLTAAYQWPPPLGSSCRGGGGLAPYRGNEVSRVECRGTPAQSQEGPQPLEPPKYYDQITLVDPEVQYTELETLMEEEELVDGHHPGDCQVFNASAGLETLLEEEPTQAVGSHAMTLQEYLAADAAAAAEAEREAQAAFNAAWSPTQGQMQRPCSLDNVRSEIAGAEETPEGALPRTPRRAGADAGAGGGGQSLSSTTLQQLQRVEAHTPGSPGDSLTRTAAPQRCRRSASAPAPPQKIMSDGQCPPPSHDEDSSEEAHSGSAPFCPTSWAFLSDGEILTLTVERLRGSPWEPQDLARLHRRDLVALLAARSPDDEEAEGGAGGGGSSRWPPAASQEDQNGVRVLPPDRPLYAPRGLRPVAAAVTAAAAAVAAAMATGSLPPSAEEAEQRLFGASGGNSSASFQLDQMSPLCRRFAPGTPGHEQQAQLLVDQFVEYGGGCASTRTQEPSSERDTSAVGAECKTLPLLGAEAPVSGSSNVLHSPSKQQTSTSFERALSGTLARVRELGNSEVLLPTSAGSAPSRRPGAAGGNNRL